MVISVSSNLVMVESVISLEVVWTSMGVEVWDSVVLINNVRVSVTVVVVPYVLWLVVSLLSVVTVTLIPLVLGWSKVAVVMERLMSVVLNFSWLVVHSCIDSVISSETVIESHILVSSEWDIMSLESVELSMLGGLVIWSVSNITNNWGSESKTSSLLWGIVISSVLMVDHWGSVVIVLVLWTNISIMLVINMNLSSVVEWLKVNIMSLGVGLSSMDWSVRVVWSLMVHCVVSVISI